MITMREVFFLSTCVEGFLYGLYSAIFAIYLQCPSKESRTANIVFYAICLLYVLSTVSFVGDWVSLILENEVALRITTLPLQLQIEPQPILYRLDIARNIVAGCCDVIAQGILIYRCWIVWGQNICVVIIPSFLAIVSLATWLAAVGGADISVQFAQDQNWFFAYASDWEQPVILTSLSASLAVNALVTGLIVFKILKVFLQVNATTTSVERTLSSSGGAKLQHIIFIIIESGMALFAIQLVRVVWTSPGTPLPSPPNIWDIVTVINQMFNGITPTIILVRVSMRLSFDDEESFKEAVESLRFNNPPSDPDTHRQTGTLRSSGSMQPQERSEDICLNNPPSDQEFPNTLRRMGSSSMSPQEREDVSIMEIGILVRLTTIKH